MVAQEEEVSILPTDMYSTNSVPDFGGGPKDKYNFCLIVCCFLGISTLFPWNVLISANNFWSDTFGPESNFEFVLSAAYNWSGWFILLLSTKFGPRFSFSSRIISTLLVFAFSLLFIPFVCSININVNVKYSLSIITAFFCGVSGAIQFGTAVGLASIFPGKYVTAFMSGSGIGGVIVGVLSMVTQASLGNLTKYNGATVQAWVYFAVAVLVIMLTLVLYVLMVTRSDYAKYNMKIYHLAYEKRRQEEKSNNVNMLASIITVAKKIWLDASTVFLIFFVTLSLFPGMMLQVVPTYANVTWYNLIVPFEFNIFDTIGRTLPSVLKIPRSWLFPLTVARLVFYPLVILCVNPILFPDPELWIYGFLLLFGLSNGFLATLSMMYAPGRVDKNEQEVAGIAMSFCLNFGIFLATNFAILLAYVVDKF